MNEKDSMSADVSITARPPRVKDISGMRRGLLVAVKYLRCGENRHAIWLTQCDCGKSHEVESAAFVRWQYQSCGCYRDKAVGNANRKHGGKFTKLYAIWVGMIQRCHNPNHHAYARYGGRGITVCERWRNSFEAFHEDMGERPSDRHSIDRINNELGYCKENCAWKTYTEQARNRRGNRLVEYKGEKITVAEWTERLGMSRAAVRKRLDDGWSIEEAVTTPNMRAKKDPLANFEWV